MKNKNSSFLTLIALSFTLASCGDSQTNELRSEFINGCKSSGTKKSVCSCIFKKIQENYSKNQLLDMKTGIIPHDFSELSARAALECTKDN